MGLEIIILKKRKNKNARNIKNKNAKNINKDVIIKWDDHIEISKKGINNYIERNVRIIISKKKQELEYKKN